MLDGIELSSEMCFANSSNKILREYINTIIWHREDLVGKSLIVPVLRIMSI